MVGKAEQVFKVWALLVKRRGGETLGEIIKERNKAHG
jgi:hypothetical protein